jgi:GT2 family glycosyltransferase
MTRTAVVILNYNGAQLLRQFLPSVIAHSGEADIIVADNGSSDDSIAVLKGEFPGVALIELQKNYGFCGGYNRALKQVKADYYVLLNSDVEVTPDWLLPLERILATQSTVAAVQPKILSYHEKSKFEYAGAAGGFIDLLGYPFCRGRILGYVETDEGQYNDEREIFWATGACIMIRSDTYHRFGGLDESLFAHMEEIDLCWKINRSAQKVYYSGKSTVFHKGAGTLGYNSPFKVYLNFRNGLILIYKHLSPSELIYKIPARLMLDWLAALMFLFQGKARSAGAIIKAHRHFIGHLTDHKKKRKEIQGMYPSYPRNNIYRGLIIIDFYLRNRKRLEINNPK